MDDHGRGAPTARRPRKSAKPAPKLAYVKEGHPLFQKVGGRVEPVVLVERRWIMSLGVDLNSEEFSALEDDYEATKALLLQKLRTKLPEVNAKVGRVHPDSFRRYEDIVDEIEMADADEESLNYVIEMLYDWADEYSVWTGIGKEDEDEPKGVFSKRGTIEL